MEISQGCEENLTSLRGPRRKDFPGAPVKTSRQVSPIPYPGKKNPWTSDSFCCSCGLSPSHGKGHMTLSFFSLLGPQLPHLKKMQLKPATLRGSCEDPKDNVWRCLGHPEHSHSSITSGLQTARSATSQPLEAGEQRWHDSASDRGLRC